MNLSMTKSLPLSFINVIMMQFKNIFVWAFTLIAKAPLASLIIIVMSTGYFIAITNALYFQSTPHPSPIFAKQISEQAGNPYDTQSAIDDNVKPIPVQTIVAPITAPISVAPNKISEIKHQDIIRLQQNLHELGFYESKIDGFYGPQTAKAIRLFQNSLGQNPVGSLTPELLLAVKNISKDIAIPHTKPAVRPNNKILKTSTTNPQIPAKNIVTPVAVSNPLSRGQDPLLKIVKNVASNNQSIAYVANEEKNVKMVRNVQLALASLGFLQGKIDGVAGEATAKAIRNFETYYNYQVTGVATDELVDLLIQAGAKI